ncbi:MAG TPA: alkaline phosphatase family protein [Actinomycetota bacterium]
MARAAGALAALLIVAAGCTGGPEDPVPDDASTIPEMLRALGADPVRQLARGYVPERSGDVVLVPAPGSTVAQWPGGLRSTTDPRTTHGAPWDYIARVPIILRGPGHVPAGAVPDRPVDVADIAPTIADLLAFDWEAPDARSLEEALLPDRDPPRVITLVVHDGGGWNVLERWPEAWPFQRGLAAEGTTFGNATVGSAPPITAPIHANMGTGTYPRTHGIAENTGRLPDGSLGELFFHEADPRLMEAETVADAWDVAQGNEAWVGLVGYEAWHLGMMSRGTRHPGGDRDVAVLWDHRETDDLFTNEEVYRMPEYLRGREALEERVHELDLADGAADRRWMQADLDDIFFIPATPAFVEYQTDLVLEMIEREGIGTDDVTDLLFVELKPSDNAGHLWNMESPMFEEVLRAQDRAVERIVGALDERVGPDRHVVIVSADHGQSPRPDVVEGLRIDRFRVQEALNDAFGAEVVEAVHPDDLYLRWDVLGEIGATAEDVARAAASLRFDQVAPQGTDLEALSEELAAARPFAAAIPVRRLVGLSEEEVAALGAGAFPEADLTSPPDLARLLRR